MSEVIENYFSEKDMYIPLEFGEITLRKYRCRAIVYCPDIFLISPVSSLRYIETDLFDNNKTIDLFYGYSCPVVEDIAKLSISKKKIYLIESIYKHFYVETTGSFESYLKTKKKKTVATLKRKLRKIAATNTNSKTFTVYTSPDEFEDFFKLAIPISEKSYQQRLFNQGLPTTKKFKDKIVAKSKNGQIIGYILRVNNIPAAYNLCPIYGECKVLYDYTGYDAKFSQYSPGTILQFLIIEDLFKRNNIKYYDLCTGEGEHKKIFATNYICCANIYCFRFKIKLLVIFIIKKILSFFSSIIVKILTIFDLKKKIKKIIRRYYGRKKSG